MDRKRSGEIYRKRITRLESALGYFVEKTKRETAERTRVKKERELYKELYETAVAEVLYLAEQLGQREEMTDEDGFKYIKIPLSEIREKKRKKMSVSRSSDSGGEFIKITYLD